MKPVRYLGALAIAVLLAGCGSKGTEQHDVAPPPSTSTSAASTPPAAEPTTPGAAAPNAGPVPFRDYLASIGVQGTPLPLAEATGLEVTVPVPQGWERSTDPMFATGVEFIQKTGESGPYPSVTVMAIKLSGDFDPASAIQHATTDALPRGVTDVTESVGDYGGFPSAVTQGTSGSAEHYSRIVIATVPDGQHYMVQLTVATRLDQPIAQSPDLSSIVSGFAVAVK